MGKATGFLEYSRVDAARRPVDQRLRDFREFTGILGEEECRRQGARCMDCGIPFCHAVGCPLHNLIPEWNDLVYRGRWREAYERLSLTNPFPEITGRICPAPCEPACTLSINSSPVAIKSIELAIIERAFDEGWVCARPPVRRTGKNIAIIGSGPAGLAAATCLARDGHTVVVFERDRKIGGLLRYGIPDFKLEKRMLDRRIECMKTEGVRFESDVIIGEDLSVRYLKRSFDVILLALGAGTPRDLHVPGRGLEGIHFAMDYLSQQNRFIAGECDEHEIINARGKRVLVIGGGDTGSDCVGTANRQGAGKVYQFEIMPPPQKWNESWNPSWPAWPPILRTTSSHEEGCERRWAITTKQFYGGGVHVQQGQFAQVEWNPDRRMGMPNMKEVPGSEFTLDVDLVLLAMGFVHVEHSKLLQDLGVSLDEHGNIKAGSSYSTSSPGVFAAGDAVLGASLVVRAMYQGYESAKSINSYLKA